MTQRRSAHEPPTVAEVRDRLPPEQRRAFDERVGEQAEQAERVNGIVPGPNAITSAIRTAPRVRQLGLETMLDPAAEAEEERRKRKRAQGRLARDLGEGFEAEIEKANAHYEGMGLACVRKIGPRLGGFRREKAGAWAGLWARVLGAGPADWVGWAVPQGGRGPYPDRAVPVMFDTKRMEATCATYRHAMRDLHQLDTLLAFRGRHERAGALAFLLVCDVELGVAYYVDQIERLRVGEAVRLRAEARTQAVRRALAAGGVADFALVPFVRRSSQRDVARGALPWWPWLDLLGRFGGQHRAHPGGR